jgi:hypothetical protein
MSKTILLSKCAVVLMLTVSCAQARGPQDYFEVVNNSNPTPRMTEKPVETSFWGSLRNNVGNGMRSVGDWLRQEDNTKTDIGKLSSAVKQVGCACASEQTGGLVSVGFFQQTLNPLGNMFRSLGSSIRTVSEAETLTRTLLNKANIHVYSSSFEVNNEVLAITKALAKKGDTNTFFDLLKSVRNRGHKLDQEKIQAQYALEVAKEIVVEAGLSEDGAKLKLRARLESLFEKAGLAITEIANMVSEIFKKAKDIVAAEKARN